MDDLRILGKDGDCNDGCGKSLRRAYACKLVSKAGGTEEKIKSCTLEIRELRAKSGGNLFTILRTEERNIEV